MTERMRTGLRPELTSSAIPISPEQGWQLRDQPSSTRAVIYSPQIYRLMNLAGLMNNSGNHKPANQEWQEGTLVAYRGNVETKVNGRKYIKVLISLKAPNGVMMTCHGTLTLPYLGEVPKIGAKINARYAPYNHHITGELMASFDVTIPSDKKADDNDAVIAAFGGK